MLEINKSILLKSTKIQSKKLFRVLKELYKDEISLAIETELNKFVVVQLIDKIDPSTIPQFNYVKDVVQESFIIFSQREMVRSFLDSLIAEKKVKVF